MAVKNHWIVKRSDARGGKSDDIHGGRPS
jgi:hypothetical protein